MMVDYIHMISYMMYFTEVKDVNTSYVLTTNIWFLILLFSAKQMM